jgi:hypothetical protein
MAYFAIAPTINRPHKISFKYLWNFFRPDSMSLKIRAHWKTNGTKTSRIATSSVHRIARKTEIFKYQQYITNTRGIAFMKKKMIQIFYSGLLLSMLAPASAWAAVCSFGPSRVPEPSLQDVVNNSLTTPVDTTTDCIDNDAHWQLNGRGEATIMVEIAGFAPQNTFGLYDSTNSESQLQIFSGPDSNGERRFITVTESDSNYLFQVWEDEMLVSSALFGSATFGFYLGTPEHGGHTYFSDTDLNSDGVDHLYAYAGNDSLFTDHPNVPEHLRNTQFGANMHLLAWEDLLNGGDRDYQDLVLAISNMTPVPLPASLVLLASGLLLAGIRRRKANSVL